MAFFFYLGEGEDVTNEMTAPWRETTLPTIISRCDSPDIYNEDEFGLFYKALPTKSMHLKGEKYSVGKNSMIRLTDLPAANMCGGKNPMFVIGKSSKSRRLRRLKALHVDTVRKKRVGWTPNYLKNGSENKAESLR